MKENKNKEKICLICGKKSDEDICNACKDRIQSEAVYKKKKIEKEERD